MKIILQDEHKSLRPFESEELNQLTIITGKNGSGKTQLLDLIDKKSKNDSSVRGIRFELDPVLEHVQAEGIIKEATAQISHDHWKQIVSKNLNAYKALSPSSIEYLKYVIDHQLITDTFKKDVRAPLLSDTQEYKSILAKANSELTGSPILQENEIIWKIQRNVKNQILNSKNEGMFIFIQEICLYTGKEEKDLADADFYNSPIQEHLIDENDLFTSQVELIFYNYAKRRDQNRKELFYKEVEGEENNSIPDKEFIIQYIPPWDVINNILDNLNIDFYFKGIEKKEFTIEVPMEFNLLKKSSGKSISFNDLSSGEKVIIGLIIKLFTSQYYQELLTFPDLLILDEPDAHLHPEMSKLLLDVLDETFVQIYGINIIITTHSPSTIALAKEEQIYELKNGEGSSLKKISKDDALKLLTSFIPTLSIDYQNHKQVFVESPTDRFYYQTIFDRLQQDVGYPFRLYFISNGYGQGNCQQVVDIVNAIRNSNNTTCFGLIDWDCKNTATEFIKVHGESSRYSIENYTYDPIYIVILFLEMQALSVHQALGVDLSFNEYNLGNSLDLIEKSIDWFFNKYYETHNISDYEKSNKRNVSFHNNISVEIPVWYLEFQGHDLEDRLKAAFPPLDRYHDEGKLQKELSLISAKCYPFIHKDTVNVISEIINAD
jgi:predicted ATP-binding protein involved in virulence